MLLIYETSTRRLASVIESDGVNTVELNSTEPPTDVVSIDKSSVALRAGEVIVIDSTTSGTRTSKTANSAYHRLIKPLLEDLFEVKHRYLATESRFSIKQFAKTLRSNGKPIFVVIIAGDTSVNEFVNSLSDTEKGLIKLFVVPAGTGNSLSLSLGITDEVKAVQKLFATLQDLNLQPLNTYEAAFPEGTQMLFSDGERDELCGPILFLVVASWAFHASLVADSDTTELRKYGIDRFKMAAQLNLSREQVYNGNFEVGSDGKIDVTRKGPFAYFVVTPSQRFEPTFLVLPEGNILDRNLFVVGFNSATGPNYIMEIMMQVYDGGAHVRNENVFYDKVTEKQTIILRLERNALKSTRRFCIDGAIILIPEDADGKVIEISYAGSTVRGWDIEICA